MNDLTTKRAAVRTALVNAAAKGALGITSAITSVPEGKLREFANGDDSALTDFDVGWLASSLENHDG